MVLTSKTERAKKEQSIHITELCRQKLLGYSEGFRALAQSFEQGFESGSEDRLAVLEAHRNWENGKVISENLQEMARLMSCMAAEELNYIPVEGRRCRMITRALREEGILADHLSYIPGEGGMYGIGMTLSAPGKGTVPASEVADLLSVLLHVQMQVSAVSPYLVDGQEKCFLFHERPAFMALTGFAKAVQESEEISGDAYALLESENGRMTILLSDGTGSGERASRDSGRVLDLMEKMMEAGCSTRTALHMINSSVFAAGRDDCHPTLDVCSLNLYQGKYELLKVGGELSFIKRRNRVKVVGESSLPLGIFRQADIEEDTGTLRDGDYLIMMTDGVVNAFCGEDPEQELADSIEAISETNPSQIAEKLLHRAIQASDGHILDDMTIIVAGIWENSSIT